MAKKGTKETLVLVLALVVIIGGKIHTGDGRIVC